MGQGQNKIASSLLDIQPTAVLEFYRVYPDTLAKPSLFIPIHNGSAFENNIVWQGIQYIPMPIEGEGFEINGNGQFSRPKLRIANKDYLITNLLQNNYDFKNAKIIRSRTFLKYLDDENFDGGNPFGSQDFTAEISNDTYLVSQKTIENKLYVELELTSPLDLENFEVNSRLILAKYCYWQYRGHGCNYIGGPVEKEDGFGFSTTKGLGYIIEYANNSSFDIIRGSYSWQEAKSDAESRGGRLAILNTESKNKKVPSYISQALWIGATDEESEGVWKWIDGTLVNSGYSNWQDGEPNNVAGSENYLTRYPGENGRWNDLNKNGYVSTPITPKIPSDGLLTNPNYIWSSAQTYHKGDICYLENSKIFINGNPKISDSYTGPLRNWYVCISDDTTNQNPESNPSFWQKDGCTKKVSACKKRFNVGRRITAFNTQKINSYDLFVLKGLPISSKNLESTATTYGYARVYDTNLSSKALFHDFTVAGSLKLDGASRASVNGAGLFQLNGNSPIALKVDGKNYVLIFDTTVLPSSANAYKAPFCISTHEKTLSGDHIKKNNFDFISLIVKRPLSSPHNYLRYSDRFNKEASKGYWGNNNVQITNGGIVDFLGGSDACSMKVVSGGTYSNLGVSNFSDSTNIYQSGKNTAFVKSLNADLGITSYTDFNQTVTFSIFVKKATNGARFFYIRNSNMLKGSTGYKQDNNGFIVFDLDVGSFIPWNATKSVDVKPTTDNAAYGNYFQPFYSVTDHGNGWKRLSITFLNDVDNTKPFNGVNFGVLPGTLLNTPIFNKTRRSVVFSTGTNHITMSDGSNHGLKEGDKISFYSIATTGGIAVNTYYFVKLIPDNNAAFKVSLTFERNESGPQVLLTKNGTGVIKSPDCSLTANYTANSLEVYIHGAQLNAGRQPSWYYKTVANAYFHENFNINEEDSIQLKVNNKILYYWKGETRNHLLHFDPSHQLELGGSPTAAGATTINADLSNWAVWGRSLNLAEEQYLQKLVQPPGVVVNNFDYYPRKYSECTGDFANITGKDLYAWWSMRQGSSNILPGENTSHANLTAFGNYSFSTVTNSEAVNEYSPSYVTSTSLPFGGFPGTDGFSYG